MEIREKDISLKTKSNYIKVLKGEYKEMASPDKSPVRPFSLKGFFDLRGSKMVHKASQGALKAESASLRGVTAYAGKKEGDMDGTNTVARSYEIGYHTFKQSKRTISKNGDVKKSQKKATEKGKAAPVRIRHAFSPIKRKRQSFEKAYKAGRNQAVKNLAGSIYLKMPSSIQKMVSFGSSSIRLAKKALASTVRAFISTIGSGSLVWVLLIVLLITSIIPGFNFTTTTLTGGGEISFNGEKVTLDVFTIDDWSGEWLPFDSITVNFLDERFTYEEGSEHLEGVVLDNQLRITGTLRGAGIILTGDYNPEEKEYLKGTILMNVETGFLNKGRLNYPLSKTAILTSGFGPRESFMTDSGQMSGWYHTGIDLAISMGTPVLAAESGTVTVAQWLNGWGNCVFIDHGDGLMTRYGHMSAINAKPGQIVVRGQQIGLVGSTGNSTGPHLHFEVLVDGETVDPTSFLDEI